MKGLSSKLLLLVFFLFNLCMLGFAVKIHSETSASQEKIASKYISAKSAIQKADDSNGLKRKFISFIDDTIEADESFYEGMKSVCAAIVSLAIFNMAIMVLFMIGCRKNSKTLAKNAIL